MTQAQAFEILKTGANIFLTGNAGSGKTYLLNRYISWLKQTGIDYAVTASTGIAATHIGGMTVHSFSGIGIRKFLSAPELDELSQRKYLWDRFKNLKVLIIDEISMLSKETLDMTELVCRTFKDSGAPFGGLQVILTGDFFQLPPISRESDPSKSIFAYNSSAWQKLDPVICYLSEQHRQNDPDFTEILNAIRDESVDEKIKDKLKTRMGNKGVGKIARLYAHNESVDSVNEEELSKLDGDHFEYQMETFGKGSLLETLKKGVLAPEILKLKKGALVMCVKNNYEKGYVNGTLGTVMECEAQSAIIKTHQGKTIKIEKMPWTVEENGTIKAQIEQLPLRLAWAITIHKSQGMSLDAAEVDLSRSFTHGMGYVALSRVRSLSGLYVLGLNDMAFSVHPDVSRVDKIFKSKSTLSVQAINGLSKEEVLKRQQNYVKRCGGGWVTPEEFEKNFKMSPAVGEKMSKNSSSKHKTPTELITKSLIESGKNIKEVAKERDMAEGTIISHLEKLIEKKSEIKMEHLKPSPQALSRIIAAFQKSEDTKLTPVKEILDMAKTPYSFEEIRLARLFLDSI